MQSKFMYECIILAGGNNWRLKPDTDTPKRMLKIGDFTLLERQIAWLKRKGYAHIVIASKEEFNIVFNKTHGVEFSLENKKLGTGGAVKQAMEKITSDIVYVMNVDDVVNYNPLDMFMTCQLDACVLVAKPTINSAVTTLRQDTIIEFVDKPKLDLYTSAGHYVFKRHVIESMFPKQGSFETEVLPKLAKERRLNCERLRNEWATINTYKEYLTVCENYEAVFLNILNKA
jgi:D-glycero-alpha-D-manno-heptose 1-phosphate guanylyltransferase